MNDEIVCMFGITTRKKRVNRFTLYFLDEKYVAKRGNTNISVWDFFSWHEFYKEKKPFVLCLDSTMKKVDKQFKEKILKYHCASEL